LLGLFLVALAIGFLRSTVSMFKIGAADVGGRRISRRTSSVYHLFLGGWMALMSIVSIAAATVSIAHGAFGIDMRFWL
jgi:uncharacterized membrane protein YccF (DUF307 family)